MALVHSHPHTAWPHSLPGARLSVLALPSPIRKGLSAPEMASGWGLGQPWVRRGEEPISSCSVQGRGGHGREWLIMAGALLPARDWGRPVWGQLLDGALRRLPRASSREATRWSPASGADVQAGAQTGSRLETPSSPVMGTQPTPGWGCGLCTVEGWGGDNADQE